MSSCLSGGGRAPYGFDLDIVKTAVPSSSPSPRSSSHSSSPSSTLSESSNSPLAISTKKPRTQRKRPNQTYSEAAALLAKIYPNIFSTKNLRNKHSATRFTSFSDHRHYLVEPPAELLPAFPPLADAAFLLQGPAAAEMVPPSLFDPKSVADSVPKSCCWSPTGSDLSYADRPCSSPASCLEDGDDDFDAESILDEEVGEGIDSIMGDIKSCGDSDGGIEAEAPLNYADQINPYLGHPMALKFYSGFGFGFSGNITAALRRGGGGDWWCSSATVEMQNIVPKLSKPPSPEKKKKKKKLEKLEKVEEKLNAAATAEKGDNADSTARGLKSEEEDSSTSKKPPGNLKPALSLKLNFDGVLKEWSDRGSPFSEASDSAESPSDIIARLSDIDLLSEAAGSSGLREASVLRYKEKRRSRLFFKKIRYQVRKANADQRPRTKASGRFVKKDDD